MKQTLLKRKTALKRTPSKKQAIKDKAWREITDKMCEELNYICQWSGECGHRDDPEDLNYLDGHHMTKRRFNIHTKENCYIVKRKYHHTVDNVDVRIIPNLKVYKEVENE